MAVISVFFNSPSYQIWGIQRCRPSDNSDRITIRIAYVELLKVHANQIVHQKWKSLHDKLDWKKCKTSIKNKFMSEYQQQLDFKSLYGTSVETNVD